MENAATPNITSFVIRFVQAESASASSPSFSSPLSPELPYRGTIRHVQTDEEIGFTRWEDAVAFIQRFIPLLTQP